MDDALIEQKGYLRHNEYIVCNPAQIRLRYLVVTKKKGYTPLTVEQLAALPMYKPK